MIDRALERAIKSAPRLRVKTRVRGRAFALADLMRAINVGPSDACWYWMGSVNAYGYGVVWELGRPRLVTRMVCELLHGPIPSGMFVLHSCDMPRCCNPSHLRVGTPAENAADKVVRGRCRTRSKGSLR